MMNPAQRDELILSHLPQVELLDLISAGTVGLIQAVDRFDPTRNLKLKTLAEHRISGALLDYLRQIDPLPRSVRRFQKRRDAAIVDITSRGEVPTRDRVANAIGAAPRKYDTLSRMIVAAEPFSLQDVHVRRPTG